MSTFEDWLVSKKLQAYSGELVSAGVTCADELLRLPEAELSDLAKKKMGLDTLSRKRFLKGVSKAQSQSGAGVAAKGGLGEGELFVAPVTEGGEGVSAFSSTILPPLESTLPMPEFSKLLKEVLEFERTLNSALLTLDSNVSDAISDMAMTFSSLESALSSRVEEVELEMGKCVAQKRTSLKQQREDCILFGKKASTILANPSAAAVKAKEQLLSEAPFLSSALHMAVTTEMRVHFPSAICRVKIGSEEMESIFGAKYNACDFPRKGMVRAIDSNGSSIVAVIRLPNDYPQVDGLQIEHCALQKLRGKAPKKWEQTKAEHFDVADDALKWKAAETLSVKRARKVSKKAVRKWKISNKEAYRLFPDFEAVMAEMGEAKGKCKSKSALVHESTKKKKKKKKKKMKGKKKDTSTATVTGSVVKATTTGLFGLGLFGGGEAEDGEGVDSRDEAAADGSGAISHSSAEELDDDYYEEEDEDDDDDGDCMEKTGELLLFVEVSGLRTNTVYGIRVRGVNDSGVAAYSQCVAYYTQGVDLIWDQSRIKKLGFKKHIKVHKRGRQLLVDNAPAGYTYCGLHSKAIIKGKEMRRFAMEYKLKRLSTSGILLGWINGSSKRGLKAFDFRQHVGQAQSGAAYCTLNSRSFNGYVGGQSSTAQLTKNYTVGDRIQLGFDFKKKSVRACHNGTEIVNAFNKGCLTHSAICPAVGTATSNQQFTVFLKEVDYDKFFKSKKKKRRKKKKKKKAVSRRLEKKLKKRPPPPSKYMRKRSSSSSYESGETESDTDSELGEDVSSSSSSSFC